MMVTVKPLLSKNGFTLIESLLALVIISTLSIIGLRFAVSGAELYSATRLEAAAEQELWAAMERILKETDEAAVFGISSITPLSISFTNQWKKHCSGCEDKSTLISYRLNGTTLERMGNITGIWYPLATDIYEPAGGGGIFSRASATAPLKISMRMQRAGYAITLQAVQSSYGGVAEVVR